MFPPWDSDYHLNINLQMNYWPAEVTNLAELHQPLFDYLESLREPGRKTARVHYGANGFVAHHISDIWGFTTPGDRPRSGLWPTGAAWLTQHLWEHYLFNPDRAFLAKAYPGHERGGGVLPRLPRRRSARRRAGSSAVRRSRPRIGIGLPNGQVGILSMGPSMDHQIITGLFTQVIRAERDSRHRCRVPRAASPRRRRRIPAPVIGKHGQIQEWADDYDEPDPGHRHISQLFALHPGDQITVHGTPQLARPRARRSSGGWPTAAATRAGAARGSSISGRACRTASRRTRTIRRCSRNRRCRTCGICIRRFRSTAISAAPRAWPRCCCRATTAPFTCCRQCRAPGLTDSSPALRARGGVDGGCHVGGREADVVRRCAPSCAGVQELRVPAGHDDRDRFARAIWSSRSASTPTARSFGSSLAAPTK